MKIYNILIIILAVIVVYIILKNYKSKKIEKFSSTCTASLTDWEKSLTQPSGKKLTNLKWKPLKEELEKATKDIVSLSFNDDLYKNNVFDYTIDINDYIEINRNGSIEYWKPIKKWKDGVVSHFCKELCILKLGYEWIKVTDISNLDELSINIGPEKTNSIKELMRPYINREYILLDETEVNNILGASYIKDNNYIVVDNENYKVAANIPIGRKWRVVSDGVGYIGSEMDAVLSETSNLIVSHFNNMVTNIGDVIILSESKYEELFGSTNLTEKYVIQPNLKGKFFIPELFEYDKCYQKSCAVFANKEFEDYIKLINLRESMGYKTSSFGHTTDIMTNADNKLLNLVTNLQKAVDNRKSRGNCSYSLLLDKLIEVIRTGEFVREDDSTDPDCPKTYDPHTYVKKPTEGVAITYEDICNDLNNEKYRKMLNPEIYKYIVDGWISDEKNSSWNLEKNWDNIKGKINLEKKYGNDALKNKLVSKNQLSELILKYLDDIEYKFHQKYRKPGCNEFDECDGSGIIMQHPTTKEFIDSKNNKLNETDSIELYSDINSYYWERVPTASNAKKIPSVNLGKQLSYGTTEFKESDWDAFKIETPSRYDIFEYEGKFYKYLGLLPRYIKMGKVAPDKYIEITDDNIEKVGKKPNSNYITISQCNDRVINAVNDNQTKLDKITELTDTYYENLLSAEKDNINTLTNQLSNINTNINSTYDSLCSKYDSGNYKLHSTYNSVKFTKNTSLNILDKINLNELAQKTIKLKEINTTQKNKKFNKQTQELVDTCRFDECRDFGNITDKNKIDILEENRIDDIITISLNDFSRIINKINILENDYILINTTTLYKILSIYDDNINDKINSDFSKKNYPDIFNYTYDDFISINIDLHKINVNNDYYIMVNDITYELVMDNLFKNFISNYKSVYEKITNITLTNYEKCLNNGGELLFANRNAIIKGENSCTKDNHSCKENIFEKEYTSSQYDNMMQITNENKKSWVDNNYLSDYDNIYKSATGYDIAETYLDNRYANFWKNRYHNEEMCPPYGTGKNEEINGVYNVNPLYNYGLKWKKLPDSIDISGKTIIQIYDYDVINTSLNSNEDIIDFTTSQNNIRFKNSQGNIINMSQITKNYYLKIVYINDDETEFTNYYEVFGTNKCSDSQICSSKSNQTYMGEFNKHVENIYNDQNNCNNLNTKYSDRYNPPEKTSFEKDNSFKINNKTNIESLLYYPTKYDNTYESYNFSNTEQTSNPQE